MEDAYEVDPVHGSRYRFEPVGNDGLLVETVIDPGGGLPKHHHPTQDEIWWVTEGEIRIFVGKEWRTLTAADGKVNVPAGVVHSIENRGKTEARLTTEAHPARDLEAFLTESAAAAREGLFRRGGIPTSVRGARWALAFFARYEDQVVMAFPPRPVQTAMRGLARLVG